MKRISSSTTFFSKRVFPLLWFGFLAVFVVGASPTDASFYIPPAAMAIIGFFVMRSYVWDLADEVHDYGKYLIVRKGREEDMVPLDNIMNVSMSNSRPPRITLRLIHPGRFGDEIAFVPVTPFSFNPFAKNAVAEDLISRVYLARTKVAT